jgi:hypothetical protein
MAAEEQQVAEERDQRVQARGRVVRLRATGRVVRATATATAACGAEEATGPAEAGEEGGEGREHRPHEGLGGRLRIENVPLEEVEECAHQMRPSRRREQLCTKDGRFSGEVREEHRAEARDENLAACRAAMHAHAAAIAAI